jgi:hypothetical protein
MPYKPPRFEPHAICLVERPSPLFAAAVIGTETLRLDFDRRLPSATWLRQALAKLTGVHPFWKVTGIVINFAPDFAIRFTLAGEPVETFEKARPLPVAYLATIH